MTIPDAEGADLPEGNSDLLASEVGEGKAQPAGCTTLARRKRTTQEPGRPAFLLGRARQHGELSLGTSTHPSFAIRWYEGTARRKRSGFKSRTEAAEALARVRAGLSDGTLIAKRRASIGFDKAAEEWLRLHSKPNLRSHDDNVERYEKHVKPIFGTTPLVAITPTRVPSRARARCA
jgi:hypothetical protein